MPGQVRPRHAAVLGAVQAAAWPAAREIPRLAAHFPQRSIDGGRVGRIERHIDRAGVVVLVEDLLPRFSAIAGAKDPALAVGTEGVADGCDKDDVGILRIDDQRANLPRVGQANVRPVLAAIDRFIDAVPVSDVAAQSSFAGAYIDDAMIGWRDRNRSNRRCRLTVEDRLPGRS